jgi:hypothetical protein
MTCLYLLTKQLYVLFKLPENFFFICQKDNVLGNQTLPENNVFIYLSKNNMSFFNFSENNVIVVRTMWSFWSKNYMSCLTFQRTMWSLWEQCDRCGPRITRLVYLTREQYAIHSSLLPVSDFFVGYFLCPFDILFWIFFGYFSVFILLIMFFCLFCANSVLGPSRLFVCFSTLKARTGFGPSLFEMLIE